MENTTDTTPAERPPAERLPFSPVVDLHPAARHTLACWSRSGGRTGCDC